MPDTFRVVAQISCPKCRRPLLNSARFQWGEVPDHVYELGDEIRWLREEGGEVVAPFKLRRLGPDTWRWNCGEPDIGRVLLLDEDIYTGNHALACDRCGAQIAAIACHVEDNRTSRVEALTGAALRGLFGRFVGQANIATFDDKGRPVPRVDWYDNPIEYQADKSWRPEEAGD